MYYDLVASLPHLPYFAHAERSPITRLRLQQRLRLLQPAHADQLARAAALVGWRPDRARWKTDAVQISAYAALMAAPLERPLREYVAFRMDQQTLLAALRRKQDGQEWSAGAGPWGVGPWVRYVALHWETPDFGLAHLYPWLAPARELLAAADARGLERLLMDVAWRRLDRHADRQTFSFEAVFAYFFKWDILQAWLACDADEGKSRFRDLIAKVTHVEHS